MYICYSYVLLTFYFETSFIVKIYDCISFSRHLQRYGPFLKDWIIIRENFPEIWCILPQVFVII